MDMLTALCTIYLSKEYPDDVAVDSSTVSVHSAKL